MHIVHIRKAFRMTFVMVHFICANSPFTQRILYATRYTVWYTYDTIRNGIFCMMQRCARNSYTHGNKICSNVKQACGIATQSYGWFTHSVVYVAQQRALCTRNTHLLLGVLTHKQLQYSRPQ